MFYWLGVQQEQLKGIMDNDDPRAAVALQKTRSAFLWTSILTTPFWAIFNMLPFILYKDLQATPLQVTAVVIAKPAVSLISLYWSAWVERRRDRLLTNLIAARVLGHVPFLLFPFIDNVWFMIASFAFYMVLARGSVPAWMEVLKLNVPGGLREKLFAYGSAFGYIGTALLPFTLGFMMDAYPHSWRWIFFFTALVSLAAVFVKARIPIAAEDASGIEDAAMPSASFMQQLAAPWKSAWQLMWRRPDFARYQVGFMLGGAGLIIMQPALPVFFMDGLGLSYTELALALTVCKGGGFAATSGIWAKLLNKIDLYRFNSWVTVLAFAFPFFLIAAQMNLAWLYVGYVLYGVMQAGSEMSWNLSGPLFAKAEDSSVYSSVNVLTVGLRGCFVPILGTWLCGQVHAVGVMVVGAVLCLLATAFMAAYSRQEKRLAV